MDEIDLLTLPEEGEFPPIGAGAHAENGTKTGTDHFAKNASSPSLTKSVWDAGPEPRPGNACVRTVGDTSKGKKRLRKSSGLTSGHVLSPDKLLLRMGLSHDKYEQFLSDMPPGCDLVDLLDQRLGVILLALWNMTSGKLNAIYRKHDDLRRDCEDLKAQVKRLNGMTNFTYAWVKSATEKGVHDLPPKY